MADGHHHQHRVVLVEPFACASHAQLLRWLPPLLRAAAAARPAALAVEALELPGTKWHWRLRAASLWAAPRIAPVDAAAAETATVLFSSMANAAEITALRPDLRARGARLVLYMHENQLVFPVRQGGGVEAPAAADADDDDAAPLPPPPPPEGRDFSFGWAQLLSILACDVVAWNSRFNLESFLAALPAFIGSVPERAQRPDARRLAAAVRARSVVIHLPIGDDVAAAAAATAAAAEAEEVAAAAATSAAAAAVERAAAAAGAGSGAGAARARHAAPAAHRVGAPPRARQAARALLPGAALAARRAPPRL